jgi:hypothetical protein
LTCAHLLHHVAIRFSRQARVETPRRNSTRGQGIDLIFHQRDQRRYDQRHTRQQQRRQLITQRLPTASRKHGSRRPARQQIVDDLTLSGTKIIKSKRLL